MNLGLFLAMLYIAMTAGGLGLGLLFSGFPFGVLIVLAAICYVVGSFRCVIWANNRDRRF